MERVVMCCQYSDVILWNCIYLYGTCCDVLPIQWCYTMELYLFVRNVLWCVANTVRLYNTCCDVIQWCYIMELYLFVWNVLWCVANTVMLYYGIEFICKKRVVMCCQYCDIILWNCIYLYGSRCDVLPIQWCYTRELYLLVRNVLWCVANTLMLYYGIVFICMERVVTCCQHSDVILWNCIYLYGTCCDVLSIQWCYIMELYLFVWNVLWCVANTVMLYYGIVFICKKRVVICCQYSDVILWNCIYLNETCCDVLPIQWGYTMEL